MKAFILAAGRGRRLWPHTADCPKCLLYVGGTTLLERQLFQLKDAGIKEIIVVGGFIEVTMKQNIFALTDYIYFFGEDGTNLRRPYTPGFLSLPISMPST